MTKQFRDEVHQEWLVAKQIVSLEEEDESNGCMKPPLFLNMPRPINDGWDNKFCVGIPEGFFPFNHCNTKWMLNILTDTSDFRLLRTLKQGRTRRLFETDNYYQIRDQPWLYDKHNSLETSMFSPQTHLYMNSFGLAIYLRRYNALKAIARQRKDKTSMIHSNQSCYASHVNCRTAGDILLFHFDYVLLKREAYKAIPHLLEISWQPNDQSKIVYRRRNYQYVTPFLDWVDVCRSILQSKPSLQLSKVAQQLIQSRSPFYNLYDLKEMGQVMLEYFELKKLTPENSNDANNFGLYAGRKLLRDKEPPLQNDYTKVFSSKPIRPVIPHAVSAPRRFLTYTYYYDYDHLSTLSQILSVVEVFLSSRFFACEQICREASWHKDPLLFQIYEIINLKITEVVDIDCEKPEINKLILREQNWSDITAKPNMLCWFHRFDSMNCISLLFGIMQNCLQKNLPTNVIDRICSLLLDILISSEFIEPILTYSFYDTYFGLTSLTNCVPGLQSTSVMRMMKKAPLLLTSKYTIPQISDMFSLSFWRKQDGSVTKRPKNIDAVGDFLVTRRRLTSMKVVSGEGVDVVSCTSQVGSTGSVIMFARDREKMTEVSQAEEEAVTGGKSDAVRKANDEANHIKSYTRLEIDFRYASMFGQAFRHAVGRPKWILDESKTFTQSHKESTNPPTKLP